MNTYEDRVKLLQSESRRFQQYLAALPDDAWGRQSACDLWQVADVVAHLVGVAEFYAATVSRGLQGDSSPPVGRPPAGTGTAAASAERIAQGALSARERLGEHLLSTLDDKDSELNNLLAGISPQDRDKPCYHPGGIVPAGNFVDLRFKELAMHDWDIRSCLEPEAHLARESLPSIIHLISESLASGSLRWAFWPGPSLSPPVRYRFEVAEPVPIKADVAVEGDKVRMEDLGEGPANVTFRCDTESFALLMYGRLTLDSALAAGRLTAEGDRGLIPDFDRWLKGS